MKKVFWLTLVLSIVTGISSTVFSSSGNFETIYEFNPVSRFRATGIVMDNTENPYIRLQNMMDFEFIEDDYTVRSYSVTEPDGTNFFPGTYTFDFNLNYSANLLKALDSDFIFGTFSYTLVQQRASKTIEGSVTGVITTPARSGIFLQGVSDDTLFIVLDCKGTEGFYIEFYLSTPNTQLVSAYAVPSNDENVQTVAERENNSDSYYSETDFSSESSPHLSGPDTVMDLAAGAGISVAVIFIANSLTNTSVFGTASFSNPVQFNQSLIQPGAGSSASPASSLAQSSNIFRSLVKFFKNLFEVLRDMLTDEGRSYASGKMNEILSDTDFPEKE